MKNSFLLLVILIWGVSAAVMSSGATAQDLKRYSFQEPHMGTRFTIIFYAENDSVAERASRNAFDRVEKLNGLMSDYVDTSEVNRLSEASGNGEWVKISPPLFDVLDESLRISELSGGLFDVTMGVFTRFWRANRRLPDPELPAEEEIREMKNRTGYRCLQLDRDTGRARLLKPGMQLDLGGIAKGYTAEDVVRLLKESGIRSVLVNAGGDITAGDPPPERSDWEVAIPKTRPDNDTEYITMRISGKTVTTSGDMFQFMELDGRRYSHIINPKTGLGATDQLQATVISGKGMYADAFASVLTLMEPGEGIRLIESLEDTEAVIYRKDNRSIREWRSSGFDAYVKKTGTDGTSD